MFTNLVNSLIDWKSEEVKPQQNKCSKVSEAREKSILRMAQVGYSVKDTSEILSDNYVTVAYIYKKHGFKNKKGWR